MLCGFALLSLVSISTDGNVAYEIVAAPKRSTGTIRPTVAPATRTINPAVGGAMIADIPSQISRRALYERRFSRPRSCGIYPASEAAASSEKTPLTNPSAAMANHDSICCSIINAKVRMLRMFTAPAITIIGFRGRLSDRVASGYAKAILGICMATAITPANPISPVLARIAMGRAKEYIPVPTREPIRAT